jgi:hypothetical protein
MSGSLGKINVVLVHEARADGPCWNETIWPLLSKGLNVLAGPVRLTFFSDDMAALDRAPERKDGPTILPAHGYAGAVTASTTN